MEAAIRENETSTFKQGIHSGISIAIGYFPIALTFGLLAKSTGLSIFETLLMSLIVFAGASQYISLDLLVKGTGMVEIVLTTFIVNIRHLLMSASLNEKVEKDHPIKKAIYSFGITDETFSVAATKDGPISSGYMLGLNAISYFSWVVFSGCGFIIGASLPDLFRDGMSVALYAMFIGLLVPSMKGNMKVVYLAAIAAAFNTIFTFSHLFSQGWAIVIATLLSSILVEVVLKLRNEKGIEQNG